MLCPGVAGEEVDFLTLSQITLHCYALDCASHFLFNPGGIRSLDNPEHMKYMEELSYHDSLRRKTLRSETLTCADLVPERLIEYYCPMLNRIFMFFSPKSTPLSKGYVFQRAEDSQPHDSSLMHKMQMKSSSMQTIQMAAEAMDHMVGHPLSVTL